MIEGDATAGLTEMSMRFLRSNQATENAFLRVGKVPAI